MGQALTRRQPTDPLRVDEDGFVHAPNVPGVGEHTDLAGIEANRVETLR